MLSLVIFFERKYAVLRFYDYLCRINVNKWEMKKVITLICAVLLTVCVEGKSLRDLWISMPDSLVPTLDKNLRTEFVELQDMKVKSDVTNLLGGTSVMDTITTDFLQVKMSAAATLQIKLLPQAEGDSLLCVVKTVSGPEKDSELMFYDQQWRPLDAKTYFGGRDLSGILESLIAKPDTMNETKFLELKSMIEPKMMSAILFEHDQSIVFRLSTPLLSAEDKKKVSTIKVQRKLNWNGKTFN